MLLRKDKENRKRIRIIIKELRLRKPKIPSINKYHEIINIKI